MEHSIQSNSNGKLVRLSGRMTFADFDGFQKLIALFQEARGKRFEFDLSEVDYIDSSALGMILLARDAANSNGVDLSLTGAKGQVKRIMDVTKFNQAMN
ncbi:MAG: STAS domain-containing protein [Alphaproteobacteria bacterium]|nr:STAS domain-containing protein [Alphaproteobacteria bacterium]